MSTRPQQPKNTPELDQTNRAALDAAKEETL